MNQDSASKNSGPRPATAGFAKLAAQFLTPRSWLVALGHAAVFVLAYWLAYYLRFGLTLSSENFRLWWSSLGWVVGLQLLVFGLLGQFHGWWRYVTFADLTALLRASVLSLCVLVAADYFFQLLLHIPRGVLILDCILMVVMLGAVRASWRMFQEVLQPMLNDKDCRWALLVGTDLSNGILAHQIQSHFRLPYRVRGFLSHRRQRSAARSWAKSPSSADWKTSKKWPPPVAPPTCWWSPAPCPASGCAT